MKLIEDVKQEEGFRGEVYKCTEGFDTIGYGTKLPINEHEAELLLNYRLNKTIGAVKSLLYDLQIDDRAWDILYNMGYQMGVYGLLKFKNMIKALRNKDYERASIEMLDSKWAKQTPNRANRLAQEMFSIGKG